MSSLPLQRPTDPADGAGEDAYMLALVSSIVRAVMTNPKSAMIDLKEANGILTLYVRIPIDEVPTLIGSGGRMAKAIRTIVGASNRHLGKRYAVDIAQAGTALENQVKSDPRKLKEHMRHKN